MTALMIWIISLSLMPEARALQSFAPATAQGESQLSNYSLIVLNELQTKAGHAPADAAVTPTPGPAPAPAPEPTPSPNPAPEPTPAPTPSAKVDIKRGEGSQKIQDMLKKNREKMAEQNGVPASGQGASAIERMKALNRAGIKDQHAQAAEEDSILREKTQEAQGSLKKMALFNLTQLKSKNKNTLAQYKKQVKDTHARWAKAHKDFLTRVKAYKAAAFSIDTFAPPSLQSAYQQLGGKVVKREPVDPAKIQFKKFHVLPRALELPVRDQGPRPTCAAFAGVRAVEILLAGHARDMDLSEQYFYWSSKPKCQTSPCSERGSWVGPGYRYSMENSVADIPLEKDCPYNQNKDGSNETQIPLKSTCMQSGVAKVGNIRPLAGESDIIDALNKNQPVVGGLKLSPNFYTTEGIIKFSERYLGGKTDDHAAGHAVLFVGYMELPPEMADEGKFCLIVANSWGEGWGSGGHACVTQKWFSQYHIPNAFMAMEQVASN